MSNSSCGTLILISCCLQGLIHPGHGQYLDSVKGLEEVSPLLQKVSSALKQLEPELEDIALVNHVEIMR